MRFLLDTHAFLWAITADSKLSRKAARLFSEPTNEALLSVASVWEIIIKAQRGKLIVPKPAAVYLSEQIRTTAVLLLPITLRHVLRIDALPMHHRDPFDRILLAQAIEEAIPLLTAGRHFAPYGVEIIW